MAYSINQIYLRGKLGRDAEERTTKTGKSMVTFSIATDHGKDESKVTTWHNVIAFNANTAELTKGTEVTVIGRQEHTKRDDKYYSNVVADVVHPHPRSDRASGSYAPPKASPVQGSWDGTVDDDSIPF